MRTRDLWGFGCSGCLLQAGTAGPAGDSAVTVSQRFYACIQEWGHAHRRDTYPARDRTPADGTSTEKLKIDRLAKTPSKRSVERPGAEGTVALGLHIPRGFTVLLKLAVHY